MKLVGLVALGGAAGSVCRYLMTIAVQTISGLSFPVGTLSVNVLGAFLLGIVMRFGMQTAALSPEVRLLLTTGFCGGYTTFSTFSYESARLIEDGEWRTAVAYAVLTVTLTLVAMFLGFRAAQLLRGSGALS